MMEQPDRPTALFFSGYGSFLSCLSELAHQNFQIPEDLSILSFDNDKIFDTLTPKVTVIQENFQEIGQKAAALLLKRLSGNQEGFPKTCLIPTEFLEEGFGLRKKFYNKLRPANHKETVTSIL